MRRILSKDSPMLGDAAAARAPSLAWSLLRLARPQQWTKSAFVIIGPLYGLPQLDLPFSVWLWRVGLAAIIFALVSSGSYVINDLIDAEQDRAHPRKRNRPIAAGLITPKQALGFAAGLFAAAIALLFLYDGEPRLWLGAMVLLYVVNVSIYSLKLKELAIADVMGLALGFVLRVMGGCAAVGIWPSSWLLTCTLFLAMFLAFGKRLGERRTMGAEAASSRAVQGAYTDSMLQMAVVVTGVATLVGYTFWVEEQQVAQAEFNFVWLTVLPATFALFRAMILLERGVHDDPTELALRDRPFQLAGLLFAVMTGAILAWRSGALPV